MNTPSKNAEKRLQAHLKYDSHGVAVLKESCTYVVGGDEVNLQDTEWLARNKSAAVGDLTFEMLMSPSCVGKGGKHWDTSTRPCMSGSVQQVVKDNAAVTVAMQPVLAVRPFADPDAVVPTEIETVPDTGSQAVEFQRAASRPVRSVEGAAAIANQGSPEELVRHLVDIKGLLIKILGAITSITRGFELVALGPRARITVQATSTIFNVRSASMSFLGVGIPADILGLLATAMLSSGDLHVRHPDDHSSMDPFYRCNIDGFSDQTWFTDSCVPIGRAAWTPSAAQRLYNFLCKKVPPKKIQKALDTISRLRANYNPIRASDDVAAQGPVGGFEISRPSIVRGVAQQLGGNPAPEIVGELRIHRRGPAQGATANLPLIFPITTQGPGGQLIASDFNTWRQQVESEGVKFQVADNNLRALDSFCRYALTIGRRGELTFRDQPVAQARVADLSDADLVRPLFPCYSLPTGQCACKRKHEYIDKDVHTVEFV